MAQPLYNAATVLSENGGLFDPSLFKPETNAEIINIFGSQDSFAGLMEYLGDNVYKTTNKKSFDWENQGWAVSGFTTSTTVAGAAGATITLTIATGPTNYALAGTLSVPRVSDQISINGIIGTVLAKNTAVANAHTIDVRPQRSTEAITTTAGDKSFIVGYEQPEGGDSNGSLVNITTQEFGNTIIIDDEIAATGSEMTIVKRAAAIDIDGKSTNVEVHRQVAMLYTRFKLKVMQKHLVDVPVTNTGLGTITGQLGLLPNIETNGQTQTYTPGAITTTEIANMSYKMKRQRAPLELWQFESQAFAVSYDNAMKEYFDNGGIQYASWQQYGMDKEFAVNFGFRALKYGQYTYHRAPMDLFDHPESLGVTGSKYLNYAVICPMAKVKDRMGNNQSVLQFRYKANEAYSRRSVLTLTGGAPGVKIPTETNDRARWLYRTEEGIQAMKINQWGVFLPA